MPLRFEELSGLSVTVDEVVHMPHLVAPPDKPYAFAYYLSIHNQSEDAVTILGRKWIVTDESGATLVVEGDGVVGQTPRYHMWTGKSLGAAALIVPGPLLILFLIGAIVL
jgi:ApaG protein